MSNDSDNKHEEKHNDHNLIDINHTLSLLKNLPKWFSDTYRKKCYFHISCLENFKIKTDINRYASGIAWFCKHCDKEVYVREDFFPDKDVWMVVNLYCFLGCHVRWRMGEIGLIIEDIADSMDINYFEKHDDDFIYLRPDLEIELIERNLINKF